MPEVNVAESPNTLPVVVLDFYLKMMEEMGIIPNFWLSREYLQKAGVTLHQSEGWVWVEDDGIVVFPPVHPGFPCKRPYSVKGYWSDFENCTGPYGFERDEFLDYEYIYDPKAFLDMTGKKWKVFRKNSKKWPGNNPGYCYKAIPEGSVDGVNELLIKWLEWIDEDIHDHETMFAFAFRGVNRKGLFNSSGELVGINIWDENYKYINFRYCFCRNEPFLNNLLRVLFYTDPDIFNKDKLVNDGGVLDRPSLKFFKDKMNPLRVRKVHSYKLKTGRKTI